MRKTALFLFVWAAFMAWLAITDDPGLNVPVYIAWVVAITLLAASLLVLAQAAGRKQPVLPLVVTILALMTFTGAWIGVGPGDQSCQSSISGMAPGQASDTECRVVFGLGSLLTGGMTWAAVRQWQRERHGQRKWRKLREAEGSAEPPA